MRETLKRYHCVVLKIVTNVLLIGYLFNNFKMQILICDVDWLAAVVIQREHVYDVFTMPWMVLVTTISKVSSVLRNVVLLIDEETTFVSVLK